MRESRCGHLMICLAYGGLLPRRTRKNPRQNSIKLSMSVLGDGLRSKRDPTLEVECPSSPELA